ncbi:Xaa-Pro peptidase family protein [Paenibacillus alkaliterrae]|uniref:M24 family metallopeptidase n=1 Tax=Paenibacillus alkaliterrae TaxID=320909 RepID=UPI001F159217|nr:Xaa-Pro peptidase family protein [Paenibacillus alkaliterrae]MCF2940855.1 Xaa-Pro peptidase family protein [Paenibacillus alkaliterrae]
MEALRLERVRQQLDELGLDALFITNAFNRRYLTGFTGSSGYVLITKEKALLFTDFRYSSQAAEQAKAYEIVQHAIKPAESILEAIQSLGVKKLGFEKNNVTFAAYTGYQEQFPGIELVPTENIVEKLRGIKDEKELGYIRNAVKITELAFEHILGILKPGISERDVSAELEYFMRKNGATSSAYSTIVASGERSALPHGLASDKLLAANEFVTLDFGASYEGYCSDLTRTVFIGKPTDNHKEIYRIVLEANRATLAGLKPGMSGKEGDSLARDIIAGYGYGVFFGHGLGHAFGLEIHEPMRLSQQSEDILQPGMVMTVEPGIYIPGFGGVRIEDDFVVTETGIEVLMKSNKELIVL